MKNSSRRHFLKTGSGFLLSAFFFSSFTAKKNSSLLCFSTLGCPDWDFNTIENFAAENKYDGIELRGINNELDLTKCEAFSNDVNIKTSLQKLTDKNLTVVDL